MKTRLIASAVLIAVFAFVAITASAAPSGITWEFDYAADAPCPDATAKNCVSGFDIRFANNGAVVASVPNPASASGYMTLSQTVNIKAYGTVNLELVAVGRDGATGARVESAPTPVTLFVRPGSPKNVKTQ
jgi:hypothetical protein